MGNSGNPHPKGSRDHENWNIQNEQHIKTHGSDLHGTSFPHRKQNGGGGGGGCFPAECRISTPDGLKAISEFKIGDSVLSWDANRGPISCRVLWVEQYRNKNLKEVLFDDHRPLTVTDHHTLTVNGGLKKVADVKVGDQVLTIDGIATVSEIRETSRTDTVYNLIVSGEFNFIAEGVVAESFTTYPRMKKLMLGTVSKVLGQGRHKEALKPKLA